MISLKQSKTYLTASNNVYQPLHYPCTDAVELGALRERNQELISVRSKPRKASGREYRGPLTSLQTQSPVHARHSPLTKHAPGKGSNMSNLNEDDILRLPDSSDEEKEVVVLDQKPEQELTSVSLREQSSVVKRPADVTGTRHSKRRKKQPDPITNTDNTRNAGPVTQDVHNTEDTSQFLSQSSQRSRKSCRTYKSSQNNPWTIPQAVGDTTTMRDKLNMNVPDLLTSPSTKQQSDHAMKKFDLLESSNNLTSQSSLQIPAFEDDLHSAVDLVNHSRFNHLDENGRPRRNSSSSLSSSDSVIDYQIDKQQKARLMHDDDNTTITHRGDCDLVPYTHYRCPSCRRGTLKKGLILPKYTTDPSQLSISAQSKFCYQHRHRDARLSWDENHYPKIDWISLSDTKSSTLQQPLKHVVAVLKRQAQSYYVEQMDAAIKSARSHQNKINRYFDTTLLDVAHNGYYGPKGAKLVSQALAIDTNFNKVLSRIMKSDKNFKTAGASRLLTAVVVPELLQTLVMEDMVVEEEEARKILEQSTDIGMLLCGDDDVVKRDDDELG